MKLHKTRRHRQPSSIKAPLLGGLLLGLLMTGSTGMVETYGQVTPLAANQDSVKVDLLGGSVLPEIDAVTSIEGKPHRVVHKKTTTVIVEMSVDPVVPTSTLSPTPTPTPTSTSTSTSTQKPDTAGIRRRAADSLAIIQGYLKAHPALPPVTRILSAASPGFLAPILETAFSLVFVVLIFSLITSWIVEYLSMRYERRGRMLRQFIYDALEDPFNKPWGPLLYSHPLIDVLHRYVERPRGILSYLYSNRLGVKRRLPAYIPSGQFSAALVDLVCQSQLEATFRKDEGTGRYIVENTAVPPNTFDVFREALDRLKPSDVKNTLHALVQEVNTADTDADVMVQLQARIANWYDNGMDRLNGWYKRATRPWLFWVGLVVAVAFNVDSLRLVYRFYTDPPLRASVASAADAYLAQHPQADTAFTTESLDSLRQRIDNLKTTLDPLSLPIGWAAELKQYPLPAQAGLIHKYVVRPAHIAGSQAGDSWLGWLITAFALSFGAPFWFDALRKIANVRSTGVKPS